MRELSTTYVLLDNVEHFEKSNLVKKARKNNISITDSMPAKNIYKYIIGDLSYFVGSFLPGPSWLPRWRIHFLLISQTPALCLMDCPLFFLRELSPQRLDFLRRKKKLLLLCIKSSIEKPGSL
jgi:hypothetical protein